MARWHSINFSALVGFWYLAAPFENWQEHDMPRHAMILAWSCPSPAPLADLQPPSKSCWRLLAQVERRRSSWWTRPEWDTRLGITVNIFWHDRSEKTYCNLETAWGSFDLLLLQLNSGSCRCLLGLLWSGWESFFHHRDKMSKSSILDPIFHPRTILRRKKSPCLDLLVYDNNTLDHDSKSKMPKAGCGSWAKNARMRKVSLWIFTTSNPKDHVQDKHDMATAYRDIPKWNADSFNPKKALIMDNGHVDLRWYNKQELKRNCQKGIRGLQAGIVSLWPGTQVDLESWKNLKHISKAAL